MRSHCLGLFYYCIGTVDAALYQAWTARHLHEALSINYGLSVKYSTRREKPIPSKIVDGSIQQREHLEPDSLLSDIGE